MPERELPPDLYDLPEPGPPDVGGDFPDLPPGESPPDLPAPEAPPAPGEPAPSPPPPAADPLAEAAAGFPDLPAGEAAPPAGGHGAPPPAGEPSRDLARPPGLPDLDALTADFPEPPFPDAPPGAATLPDFAGTSGHANGAGPPEWARGADLGRAGPPDFAGEPASAEAPLLGDMVGLLRQIAGALTGRQEATQAGQGDFRYFNPQGPIQWPFRAGAAAGTPEGAEDYAAASPAANVTNLNGARGGGGWGFGSRHLGNSETDRVEPGRRVMG